MKDARKTLHIQQKCLYFVFMNIRVGFGYDTHRLVEGRKLILGGVEIPHEKGLLGHSDADVLLHTICDALLGAANLRDIGYHFSDRDPKFKDIDSKILLTKTYQLLRQKGYRLGNLDCTMVAEAPKLNPYIPQMQEVIAGLLDTDPDNISLKATTNETMDAVGQREGIKAYAVGLIIKE